MEELEILIRGHAEIVLFFRENRKCSIVCIANGEYAGHKVESAISDLLLSKLQAIFGENSSVFRAYFNLSKKQFLDYKSVTIIIRNNYAAIIIALLCINMTIFLYINIHLDVPFSQIMQIIILPDNAGYYYFSEFLFLGRGSSSAYAKVYKLKRSPPISVLPILVY